MAEEHQQKNAWGRSVVCATLAGLAVSAPLLGMMAFSLLATLTVLVVSSPLLLIFSPLLVCVGLVFGCALAGFGIAAAMALAGVSTLAWMYRELVNWGVTQRLADFGEGGLGRLFAAQLGPIDRKYANKKIMY